MVAPSSHSWLSPFELQATFSIFSQPVRNLVLLDMSRTGPLRDCLMGISEDGSVGMISLDPMDLSVRPNKHCFED